MSEPLPCPFCGEAPVAAERESITLTLPPRPHASVTCENVGCYTQPYISDYLTLDEAIKRWNTRADDAKLQWFEEFHAKWTEMVSGSRTYEKWAEAVQALAQWEYDNKPPGAAT